MECKYCKEEMYGSHGDHTRQAVAAAKDGKELWLLDTDGDEMDDALLRHPEDEAMDIWRDIARHFDMTITEMARRGWTLRRCPTGEVVMKKFITHNGRRHAVWLDMDEGTVELAGMAPQLVPCCREDYRYSRGGGLYQLACDLYWRTK